MIQFNIYFGTIGKTLGVRYRFSKWFKSEEDAKEFAKTSAQSFFYKNQGKHGIPSYEEIYDESEITDIDIETLYYNHIDDMMRWYAIPTELDSVPSRKIKY